MNRRQAREIVVAGVKGWIRKRKRRAVEDKGFYRGAQSTLKMRMRKKLLDPVTWYKSREEDNTEPENKDKEKVERKPMKRKWREEVEEDRREAKKQKEEDPKSVLFCPFTLGSKLAKEMREAETQLEKTTGYKMKIVEEGGEKIMDILHTANP